MSHARIVFALTIGVIIAIALWWLLPRQRNGPAEPATVTAPSRTEPVGSPTPATASQATLSPTPSPNPPSPTSYREQVAAYLASFRTPINFYGKVVDQHGAPVPQANVKLYANDKPGGENTSDYQRQTDAMGCFSLEGAMGITLGVGVSKPGYRRLSSVYGQVTSSGTFEYGLSSQGPYRSSPESPTVFTLYKVGSVEPLVRIEEKSFRIARDGSLLTISLDQQGDHQVVLRCWNKQFETRPTGERKYDWRLEVSVPGGGLMVREDAFAFQAPEEGYTPTDTIDRPASLERWSSTAERSYFFRFEDGTFARANLRMQAGGVHFVMWESFFNPKPSSRNLESDPSKDASAP